MVTKHRMQRFWNNQIKKRFDKDVLNTPITLFNEKTVRYVNLDNAATTSPFLTVEKNLKKELSNYGSVHRGAGKKSKISTDLYENSRETIKKFVNAHEDDYTVFCSNTTAGMNQLAFIFSHIKGKVMVSDIEHSSSWLPWILQEGRQLQTQRCSIQGLVRNQQKKMNEEIAKSGLSNVITYKTNETFEFNLDDVKEIFENQSKLHDDENIKVLVVTGASNVTGYKPPIKELAEIAHSYAAMIIVDACQLLQHEKIDMQKDDIDFVVFSGHKMYAPYGLGAIVGNKQIFDAFLPYQIGGGNLPYITSESEIVRYKHNMAHDPGTPNFAGARAIHYAIKEMEKIGLDNIKKYEHALVEYAYSQLEKLEKLNIYVPINEDGTYDRSMIIFNITGWDSKLTAEVLNSEFGIGTRAGSYCAYEFGRRILGVTKDEEKELVAQIKNGCTANIPGTVRASFSLINSPEDVDRLVAALKILSKADKEKVQRRYKQDTQSGDWELK